MTDNPEYSHNTAQKIFNKVYTHLLTQNEHSVMSKIFNGCAYRGKGNLKCAVGIFIPDEVYFLDMELHNITELVTSVPEMRYLKPYISLLGEFRKVHDNLFTEDWKSCLQNIAENHLFTVPSENVSHIT